MPKHRLRFEKTGTASYISHLDLMRTFQRAFQRAEIPVRHTEGFNPHAFVSIALPLSVGFTSVCEYLDFECLDDALLKEIPERLNERLPSGIKVQRCYEGVRPFRELEYIGYEMEWIYDEWVSEKAVHALSALMEQEEIMVPKKGKKAGKGKQETWTNIAPLIRQVTIKKEQETILVSAILRAQEPGLNPRYLIKAAEQYCPEGIPDFVRFHRREAFDKSLQVFY